MNKTIIATISLALLVGVGCGKSDDKKSDDTGDKAGAATGATTGEGGGEKAAPKAPEKPIELTETIDVGAAVADPDDTRYQGLKMTGPAGAKANGNDGMALTVDYNEKSFELRFEFEDEGAVAKAKTEAQSDELDELVAFHVDTPEAVLWESKSALGGDNNFSFVATVAIDGKNIVCKNKGYGQFTKAEAEALLKTCQSATK